MIRPRRASQHFVSTLLIMSQLSAVQMGGYAMSISHSKSEQVWISTLPIRWFVSKCSLKVFDFCSHFSLSYGKAHCEGCVWKSTQISCVSCLLLSQRSRLCWSIAVCANKATRWRILFVWKSLVLGKQASKGKWCYTAYAQKKTPEHTQPSNNFLCHRRQPCFPQIMF